MRWRVLSNSCVLCVCVCVCEQSLLCSDGRFDLERKRSDYRFDRKIGGDELEFLTQEVYDDDEERERERDIENDVDVADDDDDERFNRQSRRRVSAFNNSCNDEDSDELYF